MAEFRPAELKAKNRSFRLSRRKLFVLTLLSVVSGIALIAWSTGLPLSWTADYDKERYNHIRRAIEADPQHLLGKSLDEVTKRLGLEGVPWDSGEDFQGPRGEFRIYHLRGFALYVTVAPLPNVDWSPSFDVWSSTKVQLDGQRPYLRIDGISDPKQRMNGYWGAIDEMCKRLNAQMEQERQRRNARTGG
jgi:hypothetical protein